MDTGLSGHGILVTGGAGGIGSAVVRAFAEEGAHVAVHYRSSERRAVELADEVGGISVRADLTVEEEADRLFAEVVAGLGRLDVLIANAGMWPQAGAPLWEMSYERWRATIAANLDSVFFSCRGFLRHVQHTQSGNIVIVGSTAALFGEAEHADYAAAKAATTMGLVRSLKNEIPKVAPTGRVNAVCPGWTATDMTRDVIADAGFVSRITRTMPLRKLGTADDVARTVVSLASDRISGHVTGQIVTVAGGMEGRVLHD
jgi:3-oxoacyl-[acyl-carrier protein] reductase